MMLSVIYNPNKTQMNKLVSELAYRGGDWNLTLYGEINANTVASVWVDDITQTLNEVQAQCLVIDLTAVERVDAYGFGFLLRLKRTLDRHRIDIALQNPSPTVRHLLKILKFDDIFEVRMVH